MPNPPQPWPKPMARSIEITAYGSPAPQGSKSFKGMAKSGRAILTESSKQVKPWRETVKWAAFEALNGRPGIVGAVHVLIVFTVRKPKSAPKNRNTYPDKKPDIDKMARCVLDSLTDSGVIDDDSRVIDLRAIKTFPLEYDLALNVPGAFIRVTSV